MAYRAAARLVSSLVVPGIIAPATCEPTSTQAASTSVALTSTASTANPSASASQQPVLPTDDQWYRGPSGWQNATAGTPLRVRDHAYASPQPVKNSLGAFQVLYKTVDSHGGDYWSVTTVFIPESHANCSDTNPAACSNAMVTYLPPYDSACVDASPSYGFQFGEPYGEIALMLARGWFVNAPDYEGPLASYMANLQAGYAVLDSVRAVQQVADRWGFRTNDSRHAMWGYSAGANAAEFAAELASSHAPDLKLAGAAIGGLCPNSSTTQAILNKGDAAGLSVAALVGITSMWPEQRAYLLGRLKPSGLYNASNFLNVLTLTGIDAILDYAYQDIYNYFQGGAADLHNSTLSEMQYQEGVAGHHGVPNMPVFMYHAIVDEFSPGVETDALVDKLCTNGANILYHRNSVPGHNSELTNGRQRALNFLASVFEGENKFAFPASGCQVLTVSIQQDPNTPIARRGVDPDSIYYGGWQLPKRLKRPVTNLLNI